MNNERKIPYTRTSSYISTKDHSPNAVNNVYNKRKYCFCVCSKWWNCLL